MIIFEDVWRGKPQKNSQTSPKKISKNTHKKNKSPKQPPRIPIPLAPICRFFVNSHHQNHPKNQPFETPFFVFETSGELFGTDEFDIFSFSLLGSRDDGIPFVVEGTGKDFITMTFQHLARQVRCNKAYPHLPVPNIFMGKLV